MGRVKDLMSRIITRINGLPKRRRILLALVPSAIIIVGTFVAYSYWHPPLLSLSSSNLWRAIEKDQAFGWELANEGFFPVTITEVTIGGYRGGWPVWTVGATHPSFHLVGGSIPPNPQTDDFILQPLGEFRIPPRVGDRYPVLDLEASSRTMRAPYTYGLITRYHFIREDDVSAGTRAIVKYRYLGLPFKLVIKL